MAYGGYAGLFFSRKPDTQFIFFASYDSQIKVEWVEMRGTDG